MYNISINSKDSNSKSKVLKFWHSLNGHTNQVHCICFSPDRKYLLSGSADTTVRLWSIEKGTCQKVFSQHTDHVNAVVFAG